MRVSIRYLELNNAATKNSLDLMMAEHLLEAIVEANASTDCKVIVFSSTGRAYFSMGTRFGAINQSDRTRSWTKAT